ncbi:MAG: hypothetical protein IKZ87_05970 [Actinomycetaceae bacterium]|nr:hypothetical protein [Actinomycetaceae bacterium]
MTDCVNHVQPLFFWYFPVLRAPGDSQATHLRAVLSRGDDGYVLDCDVIAVRSTTDNRVTPKEFSASATIEPMRYVVEDGDVSLEKTVANQKKLTSVIAKHVWGYCRTSNIAIDSHGNAHPVKVL